MHFVPDRFCGEDEENDPGEEFEEYLACAVCGDNGKFISGGSTSAAPSALFYEDLR